MQGSVSGDAEDHLLAVNKNEVREANWGNASHKNSLGFVDKLDG